MKLLHWMKNENSGLGTTSKELGKYELLQGHQVIYRDPTGEGGTFFASPGFKGDGDEHIHIIHSQLDTKAYHDAKPKIMWMHGEPISSVGNGISMKAITDLAPLCNAFICMRKEEWPIWQSIRTTHIVPKGIDLDVYKPAAGMPERLSGEPAVLYIENWRGSRNPLYLCVAMQEVWKKYPKARLHLYNCTDKRMVDTFRALNQNNKWWTFLRSLQGAVGNGEAVNKLYNQVDMVVSCLYPLYARGIEAFGAGKAFIGPGYREDNYPYQCELDPMSMAAAIIKCWEEYGKVDFRKWAIDHHDVNETVKQSISIYERYL
jgi:hypothetical protein